MAFVDIFPIRILGVESHAPNESPYTEVCIDPVVAALFDVFFNVGTS